MNPRESSGVWEAFLPDLGQGTVYKYHIRSRYHMYTVDKTDPYGFYNEIPPRTASIVWDLGYEWSDADWMRKRQARNKFDAPMSDLRGASRLLDARPRRGQPLADLSRAGRQAGRLRPRHGLHARRVSAGDGASVLRLVGLPDHRILRAQRALRHARRISCTWSTTCTSAASASFSTGCLRTSRTTSTDWHTLTERTSTSTPIRARAFIPTGSRPSSTTTATRCARSSSATPSSGSTSTTSTDCAWMRSRRCSTWIIRASRASGSRISLADAKTSAPCRS